MNFPFYGPVITPVNANLQPDGGMSVQVAGVWEFSTVINYQSTLVLTFTNTLSSITASIKNQSTGNILVSGTNVIIPGTYSLLDHITLTALGNTLFNNEWVVEVTNSSHQPDGTIELIGTGSNFSGLIIST